MNTEIIPETIPTEIDEAAPKADRGFTLVEILIAIVLVGILSAVVVVGISNLTSKGSSSACAASADASRAGSVVYFATTGSYPTTFAQMTTATTTPVAPAALTLPQGVAVNTTALTSPAAAIGMAVQPTGGSWTLVMKNETGGAAPTFTCSP